MGVDISPDLIGIARERLRRYKLTAELQVCSAYQTHLPSHSVDVVFCMSILHHLQLDPVKTEILRVLKPNGLLILKEPVRFSWIMRGARRLFPAKEDSSEFEYPLSSLDVKSFVEGFEVLASRSFRSPLIPLLTQVIGISPHHHTIWSIDAGLLRRIPWLAHFATVRVMAMRVRTSSLPAAA